MSYKILYGYIYYLNQAYPVWIQGLYRKYVPKWNAMDENTLVLLKCVAWSMLQHYCHAWWGTCFLTILLKARRATAPVIISIREGLPLCFKNLETRLIVSKAQTFLLLSFIPFLHFKKFLFTDSKMTIQWNVLLLPGHYCIRVNKIWHIVRTNLRLYSNKIQVSSYVWKKKFH